MQTPNARNPWTWIPTLYFGQAIPYVVVMVLAVVIYKDFGISNDDIAFYTSWLYLPWVIKPFWSPFIDMRAALPDALSLTHASARAHHAAARIAAGANQGHNNV